MNNTIEKRIEVKDGRAYLHRAMIIDGITHELITPLGNNMKLIERFIKELKPNE